MSKNETSGSYEVTQQPYTVFTANQRRYLTYLLGYLTLASSLTATIYLPLISLLSVQYNVSIQAIDLTITLYVIFQALSPAFWAPISDTLGRRPVFLLIFFIYSAASLGLAFNKTSYVALLLLRGLQSIGGSAVMSLAYGVAADISRPSERGKILGPMLASTNLGPCVGPVIGGGAILASGDPRWCFWALVIFGASSLMLVGWTLPETARTVVGNGAVPPRSFWRTWWNLLGLSAPGTSSSDKGKQEEKLAEAHPSNNSAAGDINAGKRGTGKWTVPNPFASLRIIFYWDTSLILWMAASPYAVWYCIQASIPLIYGQTYGYNDLIVGLCFLSGGSGVIFGGLIAGYLMDWNYKRTAKEVGLSIDQVVGDDIRQFPIEKARSRGSFMMLVFSICALTAYGWAVERRVHASLPLILQFFIGAKCTIVLQMYSALLVDIFRDTPGTAAASNNITRCVLSAAAVAVLQPLVDAIGRAWFFTLVGLIDAVVGVFAVWLLQRWGRKWRQKRDAGLSMSVA
jgi:MFS family permease